jgi:hypothetical protein
MLSHSTNSSQRTVVQKLKYEKIYDQVNLVY